MDKMRKDRGFHALSRNPPESETSTAAAVGNFKEDDVKKRLYLVPILTNNPVTLSTFFKIFDVTFKLLLQICTDAYWQENILSS